jgi:hypothetical protein
VRRARCGSLLAYTKCRVAHGRTASVVLSTVHSATLGSFHGVDDKSRHSQRTRGAPFTAIGHMLPASWLHFQGLSYASCIMV